MLDRTKVEDSVTSSSRSRGTSSVEKPNVRPSVRSVREVAGGLVPEAEVLPHHHGGRVQVLDQHQVHELGRVEPAELGGERHHAQHVDTELREQVGLAAAAG